MNYRVVIIGIGAAAHFSARAIAEIPHATLVAASCRTRAKGEQFGEQYQCEWYESSERMLREQSPDVAIVCTPSGAHLDAAEECARHGVHILCEKPLEITMERIRQLDRVVTDSGVMLGTILPMRFKPTVRPIAEAARNGRFGELAGIAVTQPWWREDSYYSGNRWQGTLQLDGGGALMNQGVHMVDLMIWLARLATAAEPSMGVVDEVMAYTAQRGHPGVKLQVEDTAVASIRFRGGAFGQIIGATSMYPGTHRRLLIGGRDGTAEMIEDQLAVFQFREEQDADVATRHSFGLQSGNLAGASDPTNVHHKGHQKCIEQFLHALTLGDSPMVTLHEAAESVALIQACYTSASLGRPVKPESLHGENAQSLEASLGR